MGDTQASTDSRQHCPLAFAFPPFLSIRDGRGLFSRGTDHSIRHLERCKHAQRLGPRQPLDRFQRTKASDGVDTPRFSRIRDAVETGPVTVPVPQAETVAPTVAIPDPGPSVAKVAAGVTATSTATIPVKLLELIIFRIAAYFAPLWLNSTSWHLDDDDLVDRGRLLAGQL